MSVTIPTRADRQTWERRRRAAWTDYLRQVRLAQRDGYEAAEREAWEVLQRRLRRNDELAGIENGTWPSASPR